jgi:hypothetical protein
MIDLQLLIELGEKCSTFLPYAKRGSARTRYEHAMELKEAGFLISVKVNGGHAFTVTPMGRKVILGEVQPPKTIRGIK